MAAPPRVPLGRAFASAESKRAYVRRLFARIAPRYDLITVLLSGGQDRRWKRRLVALAGAPPGARALDLACGTGDIARLLAGAGARVTGLDLTHGMLTRAQGKRPPVAAAFVTGDMGALPFADAAFSIVTTGYGLRNVPDLDGALREAHRVLAPGGTLLSLDFDRPANRVLRTVYLGYLALVGSALGLLLHGDADTYRYIPASISRYPGAARVSAMAREAGFRSCAHRPVLGGLMAIHVART